MKSKFLQLINFILILIFSFPACTQHSFPGKTWTKVNKPEEIGYSSERLEEAKRFADKLKTSAVVIVVNGVILAEWGEVERKFSTHSCRKSFMSVLYGKYVENGTIDIDKTIGELGIDDEPPLSRQEKLATIRDCLKARSGVYHGALAESLGMKMLKPDRHSMRPGTLWYYNNWDFNVLCTIFMKLTGKDFFEALKEDIGDPTGWEHFLPEDGFYGEGEDSIHPSYLFNITARDMARFGLLMLRKGNWNGKQVIPADWVNTITSYFSDAALYKCSGYGYMWWVAKDHNRYPLLPIVKLREGTYFARGASCHYILVIPEYDMIIVHRVNTFEPGPYVTEREFGQLVKMILGSKIGDNRIVTINSEILSSYAGKYETDAGGLYTITQEEKTLYVVMPVGRNKKHELFAESETDFYILPNNSEFKFIKNEDGNVDKIFLSRGQIKKYLKRIKK